MQPAFVSLGLLTRPTFHERVADRRIRIDPRRKIPTDSDEGPKISRRSFLTHVVGTVIMLASPDFSSSADTSVVSDASPISQPQSKPTKPRRVAWGYTDENGPSKWGQLSDEWALCSEGQSQSPIALSYREATTVSSNEIPAPLSRPKLSTTPSKFTLKLKDAGVAAANRSLIVDPYVPPPPPIVGDAPPVDTYKPPPPAATLSIPEWGTYNLKTFHFHTNTSEHSIDGTFGTMETHFIFEKRSRSATTVPPAEAAAENEAKSSAPQFIVLGILGVEAPTSSPWLDQILTHFEDPAMEEQRPGGILMDLDLGKVLPNLETVDIYTYRGSLTTPPGTEGIRWLVVSKRMNSSAKDIEKLQRLQSGSNVRPIQALNGRKVFRFPAVPRSVQP